MAENKQRFPGWIGPAYTGRSERFDCQELENYYLEIDEIGGGKGGEPAVQLSTPGLRKLQSVGAGPIRCVYTQSNEEVSYVVSGNEIYQISGDLSIPVKIAGNLLTSTGPVQATDNGIQVIFVDGQYGYYVTIGTPTLTQIVDPNFFATDTITFQDGYFIGVQKGTQAFFISGINTIDFPPLNEANAQGSPDVLIAAISNNRELYLLGAKSLEIWFDAGDSASTPFARQDGAFSQVGCAAPASIAVLSETFFWLGSNSQGGGIVYMLESSFPTRISNHAVEYAIQSAGDLSNSTGWAYQQEGHYFYLLNVPGLPYTWCYDMESKQWHKRTTTINGVKGQLRAQTHCVLNGTHIVGNVAGPEIYALDLNYNLDDDQNIQRIRQSPHSSNSLNNTFYKLIEIDFQMGVGLPNVDVTSTSPASTVDPRVALEISRDGGQTWGNAIYATLGKIGQYRHRARWQRLGYARDAVFRVTCTEPVRVTMLSCYIDFEVGTA